MSHQEANSTFSHPATIAEAEKHIPVGQLCYLYNKQAVVTGYTQQQNGQILATVRVECGYGTKLRIVCASQLTHDPR